MPNHWVLRPTDFPFKLCEFDGENVEWSWLYNCAKVELWNEYKKGEWIQDLRQILYVADELYPNKPPEHGLKRFLYQILGWHWDTTSMQLKKGRHPPWYNAAGLESVAEHELEEDAHDMLERGDSNLELHFETSYHKYRLQLAAIDALLHRVTDDAVLRWLNGGLDHVMPLHCLLEVVHISPAEHCEAWKPGNHHEHDEDLVQLQ
jgi:hypothetical protein